MDRLDLELYADRLALHAGRLTDDLAAARLRLSWSAFERGVRARLGPDDAARLEAVGVLAPSTADVDDRALLSRRREQLDAVERLQALVEEELVRAGGRPRSRRGA
jgi:hypothetical protein